MLTLHFDFRTLGTRQAFYQALVEQSGCGECFGYNLDALWDWLTGGMALPATLRLQHADAQQPDLAPVLALLEEAAQSLAGELRLIID